MLIAGHPFAPIFTQKVLAYRTCVCTLVYSFPIDSQKKKTGSSQGCWPNRSKQYGVYAYTRVRLYKLSTITFLLYPNRSTKTKNTHVCRASQADTMICTVAIKLGGITDSAIEQVENGAGKITSAMRWWIDARMQRHPIMSQSDKCEVNGWSRVCACICCSHSGPN